MTGDILIPYPNGDILTLESLDAYIFAKADAPPKIEKGFSFNILGRSCPITIVVKSTKINVFAACDSMH
jgi:hypothetical protein